MLLGRSKKLKHTTYIQVQNIRKSQLIHKAESPVLSKQVKNTRRWGKPTTIPPSPLLTFYGSATIVCHQDYFLLSGILTNFILEF